MSYEASVTPDPPRKGKGVIWTKDYVSVKYKDVLKELSGQVSSGDGHSNPLVVPYILTCAAAVEATLNDEIVSWAWDRFGKQRYKQLAVGVLSMNLRGKIDVIVPLLTNNKFVFRTGSKHYQSLGRLVSQRNSLVHDKSFFIGPIETELADIEKLLSSAPHIEEIMKSPFNAASAADCQAYHAAILALDTELLYPLEKKSLSANDLIEAVK